ncbi:putative glycoside hydrolase/deacetylase ChbG (UPF0249 family) [Lachnospiraceae bacterium PM6-15]|uniref:chitin disaccharide deacetylase n=1 Tax=Ohessyouella blattaphilus TaxID=2949333 RepID=UPI003E322C32
MKVIFNADDFGLSKAVNLGICEAYEQGVVRSTSMMAQMPGFDHAVALHQRHPGLRIGVHLTLTAGKPLGEGYQTLIDSAGNFLKLGELTGKASAGELDLTEVEREYELQIQKVSGAGIEITHLDSHHHTHTLAGLLPVFLKVAKKYKLKVRLYDRSSLGEEYASLKSVAHFDDGFYSEGATLDTLRGVLCGSKYDSAEIMCHPAYVDADLYERSSYNVPRIFELRTLTDARLQTLIREEQIVLCSYAEL